MKLSLNWIKEYVDLPSNIALERLVTDITMSTVEVEAVEDLKAKFAGMVVGRIEEILPHPKADRLRLTKTSIAPGDVRTIVCGGSNLRVGMPVALALPGTMVRWHGEGELVKLEVAKIRGVESYGMICASSEIGLADLFPAKSEIEVIDLSPLESTSKLEPGTPLAEALGLDDVILHIDNKSLTNRPDLWGHYGMARELAAFYNLKLKPLVTIELPVSSDELRVAIDSPKLCQRYLGVLIDDTQQEPAPFWMQRRLVSIGQRPISLLVDLTNYVMFALGQPMHVFDYEKLAERRIVVRSAAANETIKLLDGNDYKLSSADLVIADGKVPVALAGVMGGESSSVSSATKRIVLESASFEAINIRRSAVRHGLRSEASMRFEKAIDSDRARQATDLFITLLKALQPSIKLQAACDCYPVKPEPVSVQVTKSFIESRIGREISSEEISVKLTSLGFGVSLRDEEFSLAVPSWRATGDISIAEDIVEEVARLIGYDNIDFVPPPVELTQAVRQPEFDLVRKAREYLAYQAGMNEVITYPWTEEQLLQAAGIDPAQCLEICDPPSASSRFLRRGLVPGMLHAVERNLRYYNEFGVFELSRVFIKEERYAASLPGEKLPKQPKYLAGALVGLDEQAVYFKAKGILEGLFQALNLLDIKPEPAADLAWAVKGSVLALISGGQVYGNLGLLALPAAKAAGIDDASVAIFEICIDTLQKLPRLNVLFKSVPQFPVVEFELSMLFDSVTSWQEISAQAAKADALITNVEFLDEYRGAQVPEGKKSIAFKLYLSDPKATLTSERSNGSANAVVEKLKQSFGAELRSA